MEDTYAQYLYKQTCVDQGFYIPLTECVEGKHVVEKPTEKKKRKRKRSQKQWERWVKYREKKKKERALSKGCFTARDYNKHFNENQVLGDPMTVWVPVINNLDYNGFIYYPMYYPYPVYYYTDAAIEWQSKDCLQYFDQFYFEPEFTHNIPFEGYGLVQQEFPFETSFGNTCIASKSEVELVDNTHEVPTSSEPDTDKMSNYSADEKPPGYLPAPSSFFAPQFSATTTRDQDDFINMKDMEESLARLLDTEPEVVENDSEHDDDNIDDDDGILSLYASSGIHVEFD